MELQLLSESDLRKKCPVKWHENIPKGGLSFGVADVDFEGPTGIIDFIKNNLDESFSFYQHQAGLKRTLPIISEYLHGIGIKSSESCVQVTPGTMLGIYATMKWASKRDGKIVYLGPLYEPIHRHGTDNYNEVDWVSINFKENMLDEELVKQKINKETKLVGINNPSNPIGYVYTKKDINLLADLSEDYNFSVFSDELYAPLIFDKNHIAVASNARLADRTIALYGFSKAYGLAGYRSGFMYMGENLHEEIKHIVEAQLVSPDPLASIVCEYALTDERATAWVDAFRSLMKSTTKHAAQMFTDAGFDCHLPDSCFFIFPDLGLDDEKFTKELLQKDGIQVVEGRKFGSMATGHVRINCGTSMERIEMGINKILHRINDFDG